VVARIIVKETNVRRAGRNESARMLVASPTLMLRSTCIDTSRKQSLMAVTPMSPARRRKYAA